MTDATSTEETGWTSLGPVDELFSSRNCRALELEGTAIGLFRVEGEIYAIDDICSHGNARLTEGDVDGFEVECPLHAGVFDIRSGKALTAPVTRDVRRHTLRVQAGQVFIRLCR